MWNKPIFTSEEEKKKEREAIDSLYTYFASKYPEINIEVLYKRIESGYRHGEGSFPLTSIRDWEEVFNYTGVGQILSVFSSWEDYADYGGNYSEKLIDKEKAENE